MSDGLTELIFATDDLVAGKPLSRIAERLRAGGHTDVPVLLLTEGFTPGRLGNPDQNELPLARPPSPPAAAD